MPENKIYRFAPDGVAGTDIYSDEDYVSAPGRARGHYGVSDHKLNNKALKQASVICQAVAEWLFQDSGKAKDFTDSLPVSEVLAMINAATHKNSMESGTEMFFVQPTAPTGWVKFDGANDYMLHLVSGAHGRETSGTDSPIDFNVIPSHVHSFDTSINSVKHVHKFDAHSGLSLQNGDSVRVSNSAYNDQVFLDYNTITHHHTGTTDQATGDVGKWQPKYLDCIRCRIVEN